MYTFYMRENMLEKKWQAYFDTLQSTMFILLLYTKFVCKIQFYE